MTRTTRSTASGGAVGAPRQEVPRLRSRHDRINGGPSTPVRRCRTVFRGRRDRGGSRSVVRLVRHHPLNGGDRGVDLDLVVDRPADELALGQSGDGREQVHRAEQDIDVPGEEAAAPFLNGDEAVFHRVGDADGHVESDDPCCPLQRVGRPHQGLDRRRTRGRATFEREQTGGDRGQFRLGLGPEEVEEGKSAQVVARRLARRRWCRGWRGPGGVGLGCLVRLDPLDGGDGCLDLGGVGGGPAFELGLGESRDPGEEVHGLQQRIDVPREELTPPLLDGDEGVFHRVGDAHGHVEADDPRGPFQRMRRAHHRLDGGRAGPGNAFEAEQAGGGRVEL